MGIPIPNVRVILEQPETRRGRSWRSTFLLITFFFFVYCYHAGYEIDVSNARESPAALKLALFKFSESARLGGAGLLATSGARIAVTVCLVAVARRTGFCCFVFFSLSSPQFGPVRVKRRITELGNQNCLQFWRVKLLFCVISKAWSLITGDAVEWSVHSWLERCPLGGDMERLSNFHRFAQPSFCFLIHNKLTNMNSF